MVSASVGRPTYSDNCAVASLTYTLSGATTGNSPATGINYADGVTYNVGITSVSYTVTDVNGLTNTCFHTVWIKNLNAPQFSLTCPINVSVPADPGQCGAAVSVPAPAITNPCNESYTVTNDSPYKISNADASGTYPVGVTIVTWTVTDASGNVTTCTQTITVSDTQVPLLSCPANTIDLITNGGCSMVSASVGRPTYSDNCAVASLTYTLSGATTGNSPATGINYADVVTYNVGITTVNYTVTDVNGLINTCSHTVWIKNLNAPQFSLTCPINVSVPADPGQCGAAVSVPAPAITNPCNESYTVTNDSPYKISNADASGTYPVGVTIVTWTVTDASGNVITCTQTITVTDLMPVLLCPGDIILPADFEQPFASNVTVPLPTYSDNCPNPILTWVMTGATSAAGSGDPSGINVVPSPNTFNVGVTIISYTLTDIHSHSVTCSFTVTIESKPEILCQTDINRNTDLDVCSANLDPGFPNKIKGAEPITYTWIMTGATSGSGTGAIGNYTFNKGITTITWRAANASGFDECSQLITVTDNQPPTFTQPPPLVVCVESLNSAIYNASTGDINPDRPEHYIFVSGNKALDLDPTTFADNCNITCSPIEIRWRIDMNNATRIPALPSAYQTGQPSTYGSDIQFLGDGINFTDVMHTITYWIVDCAGNVSEPITQTITIKPRPSIIIVN